MNIAITQITTGQRLIKPKTHQQAFCDLADMAEWSGGFGNCGCWSTRMLADRWAWPRMRVHRFLARLSRLKVIRTVRRDSGTHVMLMKTQWEFDAVSLPKAKTPDIRRSEQLALCVVATYFGVAESHITGLIKSRTGKRGRPSREARDQDAVSLLLYLLNTSGGFTAHQIRQATGIHRRAIHRLAAAIEDRRDNSPEFDASILAMEAAYRAAEAAIRRAA